jgi:hypothetical protein
MPVLVCVAAEADKDVADDERPGVYKSLLYSAC